MWDRLVSVYIRQVQTTNKKTGEVYTKFQLVESYRSEAGPRQKIIMTLTELDLDKSRWPELAAAISERLSGAESLFEGDPAIARLTDLAMTKYEFRSDSKAIRAERKNNADFETIDLSTATTTLTRSHGAEIVANSFYERLGFAEILRDAGVKDKDIPTAKAAILSRLIAPGSERKTHKWIKANSSLAEICGIDLEKFHKDKLYRISDVLYANKEKIEHSLYSQAARLYPTSKKLFLFDLTNTYLEGNARANLLAKRGHSKEKRSDCVLVSLALVVDQRGLPVYSEIYEGNISEPRTLDDVLGSLLELDFGSLFSEIAPTIVMDRGIATAANLLLLKERGFSYVVIERANKTGAYKEHFSQMEGFTEIADHSGSPLWIKEIKTEDSCVVLCKSAGRKNKNQAVTTSATSKFLAEIESLRASIHRSSISKSEKVAERLGRIKSKYPRATGSYDISFVYHPDHGQIINKKRFDKVVDLLVAEKTQKADKDLLAGCYVIDTSHRELDAEEIWHTYMTLVKVEDAFRDLKSDLGLRPIYHQLGRRTSAHLFISVLAYHLLSQIELTLIQHGDKRRWSTVRDELSIHCRSTMVLTNDKGVVYHLRHSGAPEASHKEIYRMLGAVDPLPRIKSIATHL
ncbi:IS1634 family transposase [Ferrimicrobium sp.]|uniref:IS1634 family transposase n=1 Tax=Ferrimicrobium sp. TaxID=2926050 RepID=UPI00261F0F61|nr:IS1634 family transposase [Ferrimicrobium sp.]